MLKEPTFNSKMSWQSPTQTLPRRKGVASIGSLAALARSYPECRRLN